MGKVDDKMRKITVNASSQYPIYCGNGLLEKLGDYFQSLCAAKRVVVVSDDLVAPLYADIILSSLSDAGIEAFLTVIPNGERSKSLEMLGKLYSFCCEHKLTRGDALIALGGGVVGDLTGFCAASYMRGIDYIQIPTTFLAQIDSSVGGKTAVNIPEGKNLVGAFKQPKFVLCDIDTLNTLSPEHFADGVAEAIKYGMIKDHSVFEIIENNTLHDNLLSVICRCIEIKKQVVESDEFDTGERMLLNFGHTFGHAIEKFYGYSGYSHGMGVAVGMVKITALSERYGMTELGVSQRLRDCVQRSDLPVSAEIDDQTLIEYSLMDKKASADQIKIVLCSKIGESFIKNLSQDDYIRFVKGCYSYDSTN